MVERKAILIFPKHLANEPLVSRVIRAYDVEISILSAFIAPNEEGRMFASLRGKKKEVEGAIEHLSRDIEVILPEKQLEWLEDACIHCGVCASHCGTKALVIEPETALLKYTPELCIACRLCFDACFYGALEAKDQRIYANGVQR